MYIHILCMCVYIQMYVYVCINIPPLETMYMNMPTTSLNLALLNVASGGACSLGKSHRLSMCQRPLIQSPLAPVCRVVIANLRIMFLAKVCRKAIRTVMWKPVSISDGISGKMLAVIRATFSFCSRLWKWRRASPQTQITGGRWRAPKYQGHASIQGSPFSWHYQVLSSFE